jgi:hypothetical protein
VLLPGWRSFYRTGVSAGIRRRLRGTGDQRKGRGAQYRIRHRVCH